MVAATARLATALVIVAMAATSWAVGAQAAQRPARPGSSCAHPATVTFRSGDYNKPNTGPARISIEIESYRPWRIEWSVPAGEVVCQARVELRDGSWVGPTKLEPYATPTPTGGVWRETPGGRSRLRLIVITAARSPVRAGSSCNYPLASEKSISGWKGDLKDFGVKLLEPRQGGGETFTLQLEVTIHNPRITLCHATVGVIPFNHATSRLLFNEVKEYIVPVSPHGGLSPRIIGPVDSADATFANVYARYG